MFWHYCRFKYIVSYPNYQNQFRMYYSVLTQKLVHRKLFEVLGVRFE